MGQSQTQKLLRQMKQTYEPKIPIATDMFLPNHSGVQRFISEKIKLTKDGGMAVLLINKTGATSIKGYCVTNSDSTADAVKLVVINEPNAIGVFQDSGVADGEHAWVIISGIADVYFWGSTTLGHMARTGMTADTGEISGQAISEATPTSPFSVDKHFCEVGHVLEARTGAGLAKCILHFN